MLKGQRKHRYHRQQDGLHVQSASATFTPLANQDDGALSSRSSRRWPTITKCTTTASAILESGGEGGQVLIRLGNDESLGRELRTYLQTEKYVRRKNDGTLPESTKTHPAGHCRRQPPGTPGAAWTTLLGEMLADADILRRRPAAQAEGHSPVARLDEALEYLIQNTFTQDGLPQAAVSPSRRRKSRRFSAATTSASRHLLIEIGRRQPAGDRRPSQLRGTLHDDEPADRSARHDREALFAIGPTAGPTMKCCCWSPGSSSWARSA